jgi:hypothetical protein
MLVILHGKDNLQQLVINICLSRVVPDYLLQCRVLQLHLCSQILLVAIRKKSQTPMGSWEPQIEEQTMQDQKKKTRNGPKHITLKTKD